MSRFRGILEVKKGTPKEVRGELACGVLRISEPRRLLGSMCEAMGRVGEDTYMYIGRVDKE